MKTKRVADLSPGDILSGSGQKIISGPHSLVRTRPGYLQVIVEGQDGVVRRKVWNRNTTLKVLDK